ncbi:Uncharacterized protein APZ42_025365 [Daphnia magna]|uniref:CCHC-type domain-containing protein n=1 Tax=Daphnia magna TaxID=35525 RepID=A0A164T5I9_9CRUS|nr:Uncharacterized protein APZ42_025365 [Daphnia magna]
MAKINTNDEFPGRCTKMLTTEISVTKMWLTQWPKGPRCDVFNTNTRLQRRKREQQVATAAKTKMNENDLGAASPSVFDYGGNAEKGFLCARIPNVWEDTTAQPAAGGNAATPAVTGLRSMFLKEFQPDNCGLFQETKPRSRTQGMDEPTVRYYYEILNHCRLVDPNMSEAHILEHIFRGPRPALLRKMYALKPRTCEEFFTLAKGYTGASLMSEARRRKDAAMEPQKPHEQSLNLFIVNPDQQVEFMKSMLELMQDTCEKLMAKEKNEQEKTKGPFKPKGRTTDESPNYKAPTRDAAPPTTSTVTAAVNPTTQAPNIMAPIKRPKRYGRYGAELGGEACNIPRSTFHGWLRTTGEQSQIVETPSSAQAAEINADNNRNIDEDNRDHLPLHHPYIMNSDNELETTRQCVVVAGDEKAHSPQQSTPSPTLVAQTDARAAQRHSSKVEDHKGRDSGFADRSQLERTWESPQTSTRQPTPRRPADEEGDRSSQGSRLSLTKVLADQDLFSPVQNVEFQPEDERDEDELYTPRRLWNEMRAEYQPAAGDTELNYRQLSSESDEESDGAEGTVGLLTSFNYTTPTTRTATGNRTLTPTQPENNPTPANTPTTGRPSELPTTNMATGLLKFKASPVFSGKGGEDAADWMDRYEVLADYNRWTDADKRANFGIYLEGPARQWFQRLTPPNGWGDTAAVAATQQQTRTPAISGMRSIFIKEFLQDSYAGYQERKLRIRKQGTNEPTAKYYYEIINLCRLMDPNMSEEAKLHHLYEGLKPTLVEKILVLLPKTCIDFLAAVRRHTEAAELACNKGWAVHMLEEEREREEEKSVAAATSRDNEEPSLKQLLEVVQQLQGEIVAMKKRGGRKERSRADNGTTQSQNEATPPQRTADGRQICFYCKAKGHIKRYCPDKKEDDDRRNNTTVAMISTSNEEDDKEIPCYKSTRDNC